MCLVVYVGTKKRVERITPPRIYCSFAVYKLHREEDAVRQRLSKPKVYRLGSHQGCGCGFQIADEISDDDQRPALESRLCLIEFLRSTLEKEPDIELYACWDGEQKERPRSTRRVKLRDIEASKRFTERELLIVTS